MKDKKAALGMGLVTGVLITLLILGVIVVVLFLAMTILRDSVESTETKLTGSATNETLTAVQSGVWKVFVAGKLRNPTCVITSIKNASTSGEPLTAGNYTQGTGSNTCAIQMTAASEGTYNNTNLYATYTYTYNNPDTNAVVQNVTIAPGNFFKQVPTYFTLLAVVVLILIIVVVIVAVTRFATSGEVDIDSKGVSGGMLNVGGNYGGGGGDELI